MTEASTTPPVSARAELDAYFVLTDRFHADLAAVAGSVAPVRLAATGDVEALAFTVLMASAKSAREDLRAVMDGVKAINRAKAGLRKRLQRGQAKAAAAAGSHDLDAVLQLALTLHVAEIGDDVRDMLGDQLDSMSELTELQSLHLQMAMDRLSKMMSTLSNLLKQLADTQAAVVQNLK